MTPTGRRLRTNGEAMPSGRSGALGRSDLGTSAPLDPVRGEVRAGRGDEPVPEDLAPRLPSERPGREVVVCGETVADEEHVQRCAASNMGGHKAATRPSPSLYPMPAALRSACITSAAFVVHSP